MSYSQLLCQRSYPERKAVNMQLELSSLPQQQANHVDVARSCGAVQRRVALGIDLVRWPFCACADYLG